ncbi:hypothetical protein D3C87_1823090 [compost metagenome]
MTQGGIGKEGQLPVKTVLLFRLTDTALLRTVQPFPLVVALSPADLDSGAIILFFQAQNEGEAVK